MLLRLSAVILLVRSTHQQHVPDASLLEVRASSRGHRARAAAEMPSERAPPAARRHPAQETSAWSAVRPEHLLAVYELDEPLDATNASSYEVGRTGLTSAAPPTRSSVAVEGHAYYFGGSAWLDTPVLPLAPLESPQLTMGAWVYPQSRFEAHDGVRAVLTLDDAQGHAARALAIDAGRWVAFAGSGGVLAGPPVRPFEWAFVAVVYDQAARTVALHVDGETTSGEAFMRAGRRSLRIGARGGAGTGFHGVCDAVFVYSAPLTATELSVLRAGTPPPPPPAAGSAGYALALAGAQWLELAAPASASA